MSKEPSWIEMLMDPGIVERRMKAENIEHNAAVARIPLVTLAQALEGMADFPGRDGLLDACQVAVRGLDEAAAQMVSDLKAIDAKPGL